MVNTLIFRHDNANAGTIKWNDPEVDEEDALQTVTIIWVDIEEEHRGRGFGTLIIAAMFALLPRLTKIKIQLDDCSDNCLQKKNLYYKMGFRITDDSRLEQMNVFINCGPLPGTTKHKYSRSANSASKSKSSSSSSTPKFSDVPDFISKIPKIKTMDFSKCSFILNKNELSSDMTKQILTKLNTTRVVRNMPRACKK